MTRDEVIEIIDEMLKNSGRLTRTELAWVEKIDKTVGNFSGLRFTPRQYHVIMDIYDNFKQRKNQSYNRCSFKYTEKEAELILIHYNFYKSLETGKRIPENETQKHFVKVCHGKAQPKTPDEKAYLKYIKNRKLKE